MARVTTRPSSLQTKQETELDRIKGSIGRIQVSARRIAMHMPYLVRLTAGDGEIYRHAFMGVDAVEGNW